MYLGAIFWLYSMDWKFGAKLKNPLIPILMALYTFICTLIKLSVLWCIIPYSETLSSTLVHQHVLWYRVQYLGTSILEKVHKSACISVIGHILTNSGTSPILRYIFTHSDTPICSPIHPSVLRYTLSHLPFCNLVIHHTPIHLSVLWWIIPYSGITTCTPNHWSTLRYVYLHLCAKLYIFLYSDTALGTLVNLSIIRYSVLPFNFPYLDLF